MYLSARDPLAAPRLPTAPVPSSVTRLLRPPAHCSPRTPPAPGLPTAPPADRRELSAGLRFLRRHCCPGFRGTGAQRTSLFSLTILEDRAPTGWGHSSVSGIRLQNGHPQSEAPQHHPPLLKVWRGGASGARSATCCVGGLAAAPTPPSLSGVRMGQRAFSEKGDNNKTKQKTLLNSVRLQKNFSQKFFIMMNT